jgi:hypothetical protein
MSDQQTATRMNAEECLRIAADCRTLARTVRNASQDTMLLHLAETWELLAKTYENGH